MSLLHEELTGLIIETFYEVYNELGYGFLEKVYQNSLYLELKSKGLKVEAQKKITVYYKEIEVGEYFADLIVEDLVILELKATDFIVKEFENQIVNYLRGTNCEVGLLLNFGKKPEFRRKIFENDRKIRKKKNSFISVFALANPFYQRPKKKEILIQFPNINYGFTRTTKKLISRPSTINR